MMAHDEDEFTKFFRTRASADEQPIGQQVSRATRHWIVMAVLSIGRQRRFYDRPCRRNLSKSSPSLLSTKHDVIRYHEVSRGTPETSLVHPREVFKAAMANASAVAVLAHNDPGGNPLLRS